MSMCRQTRLSCKNIYIFGNEQENSCQNKNINWEQNEDDMIPAKGAAFCLLRWNF